MSDSAESTALEELARREYPYGFVTEVEEERIRKGLDEDIVRTISAKKNEPEWLLAWRLKAYRRFLRMLEERGEPRWAKVDYPPIDFQDMYYYAAPVPKKKLQSMTGWFWSIQERPLARVSTASPMPAPTAARKGKLMTRRASATRSRARAFRKVGCPTARMLMISSS